VTSTCSDTSRRLGEPLHGTAPEARGWFLVEQPGAWGRDPLRSSGLDPAIGAALASAAAGTGVRVQTIRRPGVPGVAPSVRTRDAGPRTVLLASTGTTPWLERLTVDHVADVAGLDPAVCTSPEPPGLGVPASGPVVLVCTHASRDRCCATLGRPIAASLGALHGDAVWETSHLGGHRFAGTVAVLPTGEVYGGLDVATAVDVVAAHGRDRCVPGSLRGRSGLPRPAQAAEVLVRTEFGLDHLGAVTDVAVVSLPGDDGPVTVTLRAAGRRLLAQVALRPSGTGRRLSCDGVDEQDPGSYVLVGLGEG
jgi:hypothetical protein